MPRHTCEENYPSTWESCKACQDQVYYFSTNRDYDPEIDHPSKGYFAELDELPQEQAANRRKSNPYYLKPRTGKDDV